MKYHFENACWGLSLVWNVQGNSKEGLENSAYLSDVCASVAPRPACVRTRNGWMKSESAKTFFRSSSRKTKPGVRLAHGNQITVLSVENPLLSTSEETETSQFKHQGHVFDLLIVRVLLISSLCLQARLLISIITRRFYNIWLKNLSKMSETLAKLGLVEFR